MHERSIPCQHRCDVSTGRPGSACTTWASAAHPCRDAGGTAPCTQRKPSRPAPPDHPKLRQERKPCARVLGSRNPRRSAQSQPVHSAQMLVAGAPRVACIGRGGGRREEDVGLAQHRLQSAIESDDTPAPGTRSGMGSHGLGHGQPRARAWAATGSGMGSHGLGHGQRPPLLAGGYRRESGTRVL
jgi:hypothetical protein